MSIEVNHLLKVYGEQKAVNDISFSATRGEIVGFLGPNGAGKSTTMKIIAGCLHADAGGARVCDIDVEKDPLAVKRKIGYLPEANPLYTDMYVREYLDFIAQLHHLNTKRKTRIEEVIGITGLQPESKKKIGQLSKGYKQRVGLAAALIHDPEVLILDEPTSGLDPNQIVEIREVIRREGKEKTILFSTHILQEAEAICDRVIIINKGEIVADDKLSNLQQAIHGRQAVVVEFKEAIEKSILENLNGVQSVEADTFLRNSKFRINSHDPELVRREILGLALQKNLNIISLQSESRKLEDIFRSLTIQQDQ